MARPINECDNLNACKMHIDARTRSLAGATVQVWWLCNVIAIGAKILLAHSSELRINSTAPSYANHSDYHAWLQARAAAAAAAAQQTTSTDRPKLVAPVQHRQSIGGGYAVEVTPPSSNQLFQYQSARSGRLDEPSALTSGPVSILATNRSIRTAAAVNYDELDGDEYNLLVSNTCERDFMLVEIKTSRPFYGVIHTLNHRRKLICTTEGDGGTHYKLSISHTLNPNDPQHCGVTRVTRPKSDQDHQAAGELLSVVVAVRLHRNIELSEDKFFALNCTNRCRRSDCSSSPQLASGKLTNELSRHSNGWRQLEREFSAGDEADSLQGGRSQLFARSYPGGDQLARNTQEACSIWKSTWLVALILCLAIILIGMLISNCIICMSLKRKEKKELQDKSAHQLEAELEGQQQVGNSSKRRDDSSRRKSRRKSRQIEYDNDGANYLYQDQANEQPPDTQHKRSHHSTATRPAGQTTRQYR